MGNISVGIDTSKDRGKRSKGRRLIGVVIGKPSKLNLFTDLVLTTARENGYTGNLHWKHIKKNVREKILKKHAKTFKELEIKPRVFISTRENKNRRKHYIYDCSWVIGTELVQFLDEKTDKMDIVTDNDFNTLAPSPKHDVRQPSLVFMKTLVGKIASETAKAMVTPTTRKNEAFCTIIRNSAKPLEIKGKVGSQHHSEVQAADILLGMYKLAKARSQAIDRLIIIKIG